MNNLIICGKANQDIPVKKLRMNKTDEVWLCGTDIREGADLYFEIHGIKVPHKNVITKFDDEVIYNESGISPSNTISGMMIYAWLHGYKNITLLGCPMIIKEYPQQRITVVQLVHYLNRHGCNVVWEEMNMATAQKNAKDAEQKNEEAQEQAKEVHSSKKVKVQFKAVVCASYGTFQPRQVAEVPEDIFKDLEKAGLVEKES